MNNWVANILASEYYAKHVYRLSHLLVAARLHCDGKQFELDKFLFNPDITEQQAKAFFSVKQLGSATEKAGLLEAQPEQIQLAYQEQSFTIAYAQMSQLLNLFDYCLEVIRYPTLIEGLEQAHQEIIHSHTQSNTQASLAAVRTLSNDIAKAIYKHRKAEGESTQRHALKKIQSIKGWLTTSAQNNGSNDLGQQVTDEKIFAFWQQHSLQEDGDSNQEDEESSQEDGDSNQEDDEGNQEESNKKEWVTFKNVADSFIDFVKAWNAKSTELAERFAVDSDDSQSTAESLYELLASYDEEASPLARLLEPPASSVKFFNKEEVKLATPLLNTGSLAFRLNLTMLRRRCIGLQQGEITQLKRDIKSGKRSQSDMAALLSAEGMSSYSEHVSIFSELNSHCQQVALATLHFLIYARDEQAIPLLLALDPELEFLFLREQAVQTGFDIELENSSKQPNGVHLDPQNISKLHQLFFNNLNEEKLKNSKLSTLLSKAEQAWKDGGKRAGFKEKRIQPSDERQMAFSASAAELIQLHKTLTSYLRSFSENVIPNGSIDSLFASDLSIIQQTFSKIYGDTNNES